MIEDTPTPKSILTPAIQRWLPVSWQVGGTAITVAGYAAGTLSITDVAIHIGVLSALSGVYLAYITPDELSRRDMVTMVLYFLYGAGLLFVVAPPILALTRVETALDVVGMSALGLVPAVVWFLYVRYIADPLTDDSNSS
jgi:hypothetical protein